MYVFDIESAVRQEGERSLQHRFLPNRWEKPNMPNFFLRKWLNMAHFFSPVLRLCALNYQSYQAFPVRSTRYVGMLIRLSFRRPLGLFSPGAWKSADTVKSAALTGLILRA